MSEETSAAEGLDPGSPGPPALLGLGIGGWLRNCWLRACGCWWRRRLTASCWLIRWAMANCCLTSCGLSWGESSPPGAKRGCRAVGGGGGGTCARKGGLWWSCPWDDGACGCPCVWGWDWAKFWGSPETPLTRDPALFNGPSCVSPARWGGGRCASTQKSARVSLSTVKAQKI